MRSKDYGEDVLSRPLPRRSPMPRVEAQLDMVVEDPGNGWCGAVVGHDKVTVTLEDRHGSRRLFPWNTTFLLDGKPVVLTRPQAQSPVASAVTRSGSVAVSGQRAQVARASRILVEGGHDAELIEKVWGDDLRSVGVVVEMLDGADNLPDIVADFAPSEHARLGVLLDHLVAGSKERHIVDSIGRRHRPYILVVGHPFVDIWAAVKPTRVGIDRWPDIPRSIDWKTGMAGHLGFDEPKAAWRSILESVRDWRDLSVELINPVEQLIDWVTVPPPTVEFSGRSAPPD